MKKRKSICKKFEDFKRRHNFSNEFIAKVATEYANTDLELARTHFLEKYNFSKQVFYSLRDYAFIFCLVDPTICKRIKEKSVTNYKNNKNNKKKSARDSLNHFNELLKKRREFLNGFTPDEILDIAHKYIEGVSLKNIGIAYETGEYGIQLLLAKGIVNLVYDKEIIDQLSLVSKGALDSLLKQREINKNNLIICLQTQINFLNSLLKCTDSFFINYDEKLDLESIQKQLENAIKMYKRTLQL